MICLGVMMFFLLRERHGGQLWKFLVQQVRDPIIRLPRVHVVLIPHFSSQGVAYACGICFAYLFVIILVSLDLNDAMSDIGFGVICMLTTLATLSGS